MLGAFCILLARIAYSQQKTAANSVQVHLVVTDAKLRQDAELPPLQKEDVKVKQGKNFLPVTQVIPAQGDNAALQLMILIDDTLDTSVGNNLTDLKNFISAQPSSTVVGVGYMSNAGVNVVQNFTSDHDAVVKAVRLPRGSHSTMDSPYLSLISLAKGWPQQKVRREVVMVSDGIDRLPATMRAILSKRLTVRGFINYDFAADHYAAFLREVGAGIGDGRIRYREDCVDGLEQAPEAFIGMLEGRNFGKLLIKVFDA